MVVEKVLLRGLTQKSEDSSEYLFEVGPYFLRSSAFIFFYLFLFHLLCPPPPGPLVGRVRVVCCQDSSGSDGPPVSGLDDPVNVSDVTSVQVSHEFTFVFTFQSFQKHFLMKDWTSSSLNLQTWTPGWTHVPSFLSVSFLVSSLSLRSVLRSLTCVSFLLTFCTSSA